MIYTEMTKKAMKIAFAAHISQKDRAGLPYFYHPLLVAEKMDDEISTTVALLHDVPEDTDYSIEDLVAFGFPEEVIEALMVLTKGDGEKYHEYIGRIKKNPIAIKVKIEDLKHNMDLSRLDEIRDIDQDRRRKYEKALKQL